MAIETHETHKVSNKEVMETLHDVIERLVDGHEGFQKIGEHLKDEALKKYFFAESLKRSQFRGNWRHCSIQRVITIRRRVEA